MAVTDDLRHNFEIERELSNRLRAASSADRRTLYSEVYDEFFRRARNVGHTVANAREVARQARLVTNFLAPGGSYLEIGAGTGHVARLVALSAKSVYMIEVSEVVGGDSIGVLISDGVSIPVTAGTIDLAYSNQVMEHLHPDDAAEQLDNIHRALSPRGVYVCVTPNGLSGPHDVSKHFGTTPQGFHLHEYTIRELDRAFRTAGFSQVRVVVALGGEVIAQVPARLYAVVEAVLSVLPRRVRQRHPVRKLLDPGALVARV